MVFNKKIFHLHFSKLYSLWLFFFSNLEIMKMEGLKKWPRRISKSLNLIARPSTSFRCWKPSGRPLIRVVWYLLAVQSKWFHFSFYFLLVTFEYRALELVQVQQCVIYTYLKTAISSQSQDESSRILPSSEVWRDSSNTCLSFNARADLSFWISSLIFWKSTKYYNSAI